MSKLLKYLLLTNNVPLYVTNDTKNKIIEADRRWKDL